MLTPVGTKGKSSRSGPVNVIWSSEKESRVKWRNGSAVGRRVDGRVECLKVELLVFGKFWREVDGGHVKFGLRESESGFRKEFF